MKKYIIDTSVIIDNPTANILKLYSNGENEIYLTDVIFSELDKHKTSSIEDLKWSARVFLSLLNSASFKKLKKSNGDSIFRIKFFIDKTKIKMYLIVREKYKKETLNSQSPNDYKIMEVAKDYGLTCITNDNAFGVIAMSKGLKTEKLYWNVVEDIDQLNFSHFVSVPYDSIDNINEYLDAQDIKIWDQIEVSYTESNEDMEYNNGKKDFFLKTPSGYMKVDMDSDFNYPVQPINKEQKFYLTILENMNEIVVVSGATGSGKTLMAIQYAMKEVANPKSNINGIVYMRYTVNAEDKFSALGYRKGDTKDKLSPYNFPIYGTLNFVAESSGYGDIDKVDLSSIQKNEVTDQMISDFNIEFLDIAHARGITLKNKVVIFDEAQNAPDHIIHLIGTRCGKGTKLIFMGDPKQVDHPYLSKKKNGLISLMKFSYDVNEMAVIKLNHTIRSNIANIFENYL